MRLRMQNLTEEDRKMRLDFYSKNPLRSSKEESNSLITKFFTRQPHASYEIRAKNDAI